MTDSQAAPLSPCVNICVMHPREGLCVGCLRTMDEIIAWGSLTDARRREIMADLPARKPRVGKRRDRGIPSAR